MSSTLFIQSLPCFYDEFSLQKLFQDFGQIKECGVIHHDSLLKSNGFVKFFNSKCAKLAASKKDQTIIERCAIRVYVVWDNKETLSTIRVKNLPNNVHVGDLQHLFSPFGDIINVSIFKQQQSAEANVSFSRIEYAIRASEEMNDAVFGPSNGNLCVELVNSEARTFKWKRNGFEYIRNPWPDQSFSSQKSSSNGFKVSSPNTQHKLQFTNENHNQMNQSQIQNHSRPCSISVPDIHHDAFSNQMELSPNNSLTSSPTSSINSFYSSTSLQSSQEEQPMKLPLFIPSVLSCSNTLQEFSKLNTGNVFSNLATVNSNETENVTLPNNEVMFPSILFPQNQMIPSCGILNFPLLQTCSNAQCVLPMPMYSNNVPLFQTNFSSFPTLMADILSLSDITQISALPGTNVQTLNVNQSGKCEKQTAEQTPLLQKTSTSQSTIVSSSNAVDEKKDEPQTWTKEQQELGEFLHSKLKSKFPERCSKLVGMILTENKIKDKKFVNENPRAFYEKIGYFNKLLDELQHK